MCIAVYITHAVHHVRLRHRRFKNNHKPDRNKHCRKPQKSGIQPAVDKFFQNFFSPFPIFLDTLR